jgi:hypothetical protein
MNPDRLAARSTLLAFALLLSALPLLAWRGGGQNSPAAAPETSVRPYGGSAAGSGGPAAAVSPATVSRSPRTAAAVPAEASREHEAPRIKDPANLAPPLAPAGSNRVEDASGAVPGRGLTTSRAAASPIVSFEGPDYTGKIPPDPIVAAGPNHIVAAVNSKFGFFTKSGNEVFESTANDWFSNVLPRIADIGGAFDPKVLYDSAAGRWLLVYLATDDKTESYVLLSISNTSDPTGNWCNITLRGDRNGNTPSGNWSDYEGVGLDNQAVYITTNQYQFTAAGDGNFQYARVRIIPKSQLYGACASPSYFDFWDLTDPVSTSERAFTLRPALTYGTPGVEYLVSNSPFETSTYFTLWSIANPVSGSPSLTARNVPVTASTSAPNADQFGGTGGTSGCPAPCLIDTGDARLLDAIYRNGSLWTSHTVAGGTGNAYALARYVRIAVGGTPAVLEDTALGLDGCWYYYPALAIDQNNNLGMVFTRSCTDTYPSIRYSGRAPADPDLQGSTLLKAGETNYLNPASGKNRWGDYSGASVDPADPTKIWLIGEYSASPANNWGTWAGQVSITAGGASACVASSTVLCLNNSRFRVSATFQSPSGSGNATGVALTGDTGYFWFFSANNV